MFAFFTPSSDGGLNTTVTVQLPPGAMIGVVPPHPLTSKVKFVVSESVISEI